MFFDRFLKKVNQETDWKKGVSQCLSDVTPHFFNKSQLILCLLAFLFLNSVQDLLHGNRQLVDFLRAPFALAGHVLHFNPAPVQQVLHCYNYFRLPHVGSPFNFPGRCLGDVGEEDEQHCNAPPHPDID